MSLKAIDVVKRSPKRATENFQPQKLRRNIHTTYLSVRCRPGEADDIAKKVCDVVIVWLKDKPEVTSNDLRRVASKHLKNYHPDAAYIYEHQHFTL